MTTSTLHIEVERSRFANLLLAALGAAVPATLGTLLRRDPAASAAPIDRTSVEAQAVRDMARHYAKSDPGFAADLYAAADRHETLNDQ